MLYYSSFSFKSGRFYFESIFATLKISSTQQGRLLHTCKPASSFFNGWFTGHSCLLVSQVWTPDDRGRMSCSTVGALRQLKAACSPKIFRINCNFGKYLQMYNMIQNCANLSLKHIIIIFKHKLQLAKIKKNMYFKFECKKCITF